MTTISLEKTIEWVRTFIPEQPLTGLGEFGKEPATAVVNEVILEILKRPHPCPLPVR